MGLNPFVASKLIPLYSQFRDLESVVSVFETFQEPNTFIWNSIIKAHIELGVGDSAFLLYSQMRIWVLNMTASHSQFVNRVALFLRNSVLYGGIVYCLAIKMGLESDLYFCNTMMGCIEYACQVSVEMSHRDLAPWTLMISSYVYEGNIIGAFRFSEEMRLELDLGPVTVVVNSRGSVIEGRPFLIKRSLQNSNLKIYANTGSIYDAGIGIFFGEIYRDVVYWNITISSYISREDVMEVSKCFNKMQGEDLGRDPASSVYGKQKITEYASQRLLELEPNNIGYYTLLNNVQAVVEWWNGIEEMRRSMKDNGGMVLKKSGYYTLLSNFLPSLDKIPGSATASTDALNKF
ncbi:pentatricopeptide repeat-containing protein CRR2, chloroplastic-like [Actinidia eriantha]|uniref:pentatricopeptide repeat-containing protein CRR2, chloroplastic-like n=1 Tax=Actinidia eriantha TaxID=165200 RepID=UPI00258BBAFE|nr:pentatricopeptide repeat-containing protein CRR2, chloroplastic-like [Actinidia eriantha]